jgi:hypothetical protein
VRRDAQGARDGELSVPRRRWPVCAIDHLLKNEPTATVCACQSPNTFMPSLDHSRKRSRKSLRSIMRDVPRALPRECACHAGCHAEIEGL